MFVLLPRSIAHNYGVVRHRVGLEDVFRQAGSMPPVSVRSVDRWIAGGDIGPHAPRSEVFHPGQAKLSHIGQMTDPHLNIYPGISLKAGTFLVCMIDHFPSGSRVVCMIWRVFPRFDLYYTDLARHLVTAG